MAEYVFTEAGCILEHFSGDGAAAGAYSADSNDFIAITPTWVERPPVRVVDVRFPNVRLNALVAAIRDCLRIGVKVVWLVDYKDRTVSVHRQNGLPDVFSEAQELTGEELPGFLCRVADLFRMPGARPAPR